ncbi:GNAT family N-acetyltransferase [Janibacter sp. G56]|uniref:GNAT family N-acetyltransferase n=1 Tax=Janibacter sp. G56 TaxID=3418717 RepID=UPI003CFD6171
MTGPWLLRGGRTDEAELLSDLALRSKAHWGYDDAFLEAVRGELTLSGASALRAVVASTFGTVGGFHLIREDPDGPLDRGSLDMLFVDPAYIGTGLGAALWDDALEQARRRGWRVLTIDADPDAEGFYLSRGAVRVGDVRSGSLPGRILPRLEYSLS